MRTREDKKPEDATTSEQVQICDEKQLQTLNINPNSKPSTTNLKPQFLNCTLGGEKVLMSTMLLPATALLCACASAADACDAYPMLMSFITLLFAGRRLLQASDVCERGGGGGGGQRRVGLRGSW